MRAAVLVCLALAGCGRLGFAGQDDGDDADEAIDDLPSDDVAPPIDAPSPDGSLTLDAVACGGAKDEDGDLFPDECDGCPHLATETNLDSDGDGVGDSCDPQPNTPAQRIARFDTFDELPADWNVTGAVTAVSGAVVVGGPGGNSISRPWTDGSSTFVIGFSAGTPVGEALVAIITGDSVTGRRYYCEVYEGVGALVLQLTYTLDGKTYLQSDLEPMGGQLADLEGTLEMRTGQSELCRSRTGLGEQTVEGTITGITPDVLAVYAQNVTASIDWMIEIRTGP